MYGRIIIMGFSSQLLGTLDQLINLIACLVPRVAWQLHITHARPCKVPFTFRASWVFPNSLLVSSSASL